MDKKQNTITNETQLKLDDSHEVYSFSFSVTDGQRATRFNIETTFKQMLVFHPFPDLPNEIVEKWKKMVTDKYLILVENYPEEYFSKDSYSFIEDCGNLPFDIRSYNGTYEL